MRRRNQAACKSERRTYQLSSLATGVMVAQLVDIEFYPRLSEETLAFNATLHLQYGDNLCIFGCKNDGQGGSTSIYLLTEGSMAKLAEYKQIFAQWKEHLSTQEDDKFQSVASAMGWNTSNMGKTMKNPESEVNDMLAEWCDKNNL
ncbi:MAG: hypothetical protein Q4B58_08915 [Bacteroidales bacterium]|nr:hypothetical protein [Bacteroidales bacterium]